MSKLGRRFEIAVTHKARARLRELLHEVQREKARDERMTAVKIRSRSSEALLL
jgi:heme exporter protein D